MPTEKLTTRRIDAVKPPAEGRLELWDTVVGGLALRISSRGVKTWIVRYRTESGYQRRQTIGRYPDIALSEAREQAGEIKRKAAKGGDPAADKKHAQQAETFAEIADAYLERYAKPNKASWKKDRSVIENELKPSLGKRKAHSIRRRDIIEILDRLKARGAPIMANRVHEIARRIFNWAILADLLPENHANPASRLERVKEQSRDRVLTPDELRAVWEALGTEDAQHQAAFRLRILTAQRGAEVIQMRGDQITMRPDGPWWIVPRDVTKNKKADHPVPLSPAAVEIILALTGCEKIEDAPAQAPGFLFASARTGRPLANVWRTVERIRKASGVDFRAHDLRRTTSTMMTGQGIPRLIVSRILNHTGDDDGAPRITGVYDRHPYFQEQREALEAWAVRLDAILNEEAGQVVELRQ